MNHFLNGLKNGPSRHWNEKGQLMLEEYYKNDSLVRSKQWYENGQLQFNLGSSICGKYALSFWENGQLMDSINYDQDGKISDKQAASVEQDIMLAQQEGRIR